MNAIDGSTQGKTGSFKLEPQTLGPRRFLGLLSPRNTIWIARGGRGIDREATLAALRRGDGSIIVIDAPGGRVQELPVDFGSLGARGIGREWKAVPIVSAANGFISVVGDLDCIGFSHDGQGKWRQTFCARCSDTRRILSADVAEDGGTLLRTRDHLFMVSSTGSVTWEKPIGTPGYLDRVPVCSHAGKGYVATAEGKHTTILDYKGNVLASLGSPGQPVELAFDPDGNYLFEVSATATRTLAQDEWTWWARVISVRDKRALWRVDDLSHPSCPQEFGEQHGGGYLMPQAMTSGVQIDRSGWLAIVEEEPYGPRIVNGTQTVAQGEKGFLIGGTWQPHQTVLRDACAFSIAPDQEHVLVGKRDGTILLWTSRGVKKTVKCFEASVLCARIGSSGGLFAVGHDTTSDVLLTYAGTI